MLETQEKENIEIVNMIYEIRGKQVMLDRDLAKLYQIETRTLNQKVKRNIERFPNNFRFQLTNEEWYNLKSQNVISSLSIDNYGGDRFIPYVFTEQGVAMLSAIINTTIAIKASITIIDAFVSMRKYISCNLLEQKYINNQVMKNTEDIKLLQESFKQFDKSTDLNTIFFEGQIYDAYSLLLDILNTANKNIIIIDNYIDKKFLDICSKININIIIYTNKIDKDSIEKYKEQYNNIKVKTINTFHDRFIILIIKFFIIAVLVLKI